MKVFRFAIVCGLLCATGILLRKYERKEILAPRRELASLPLQFGSWQGRDIPIDDDVRRVLGNGDFLSRIYEDSSGVSSYVDLFIAYFSSQRFGDTIHSPKNCLPGSGWLPIESTKIKLLFPGRPPFPANRYVIARGEDRELVIYWYFAHDRSVASEYWAKYYLLADSVRLNRSDGSLIRFVTPLEPGEAVNSAQQRLLSLAAAIMPTINLYVPR